MKKIPMRKCVATNESLPKKELIRIVRTPEGTIEIDETGKRNGRGAYLKRSVEALEAAMKRKSLVRSTTDQETQTRILHRRRNV